MLHRFDRIRLDGALALALAAALLVIPCAAGQAQAAEAQEAAPDDRLGKLEKELEKTRSELAALKAAQAAPTEARLAELERRIEILAQEIEALKIGEAAAPEPGAHVPGLGPAASKVYALKKGVSIGGYGEVLYQNYASHRQDGAPSDATDTIDLARAVVYLGYKFDSRFVLNTEIEYEHAVAASDKEGEVEVEFAYLDYALRRSLSFRAGLVLVPMGLVNELHEPPTYLGARRPDVETVIIPSTWRELGFGAYGDLGPVTYRAYLVNGLNAAGYTAEGITEGRQEGSLARAHDFAFTLRADVTAVPGAVLGASVFTGDSGQGQTTPEGEEISASTTVWDLHAEWRYRGLQLRGLFARSTVGEADKVNRLNRLSGDASVGSRQQGWYLEAGYDVLSLVQGARASLVPFLRYEEYDTQADVPDGFERNPENDVTQLTLGAAFKPIDAIVVKLDWQRRHDAAGTGVNQFNVALGYICSSALLLTSALAGPAHAKVLLTQDEALKLAFGEGAAIERKTAFLTNAQQEEARRLSGDEKPPSALVTYYVGRRDGQVIGSAFFETHVVRTQTETLLVLVTPGGTIGRIEVLSFSEPEEYLPRGPWYQGLSGRKLDDELSTKRGVRPVTGATLTVRATVDCARRVLAVFQVLRPGARTP